MNDLEEVIRQRRSIRMFLPDRPVPGQLIHEALDLAIHAPSNSNVQPWRVFVASGAAQERLVAALLEAALAGPPKIPPLPAEFAHYRSETGAVVYGSMGIKREDLAARRTAVLRNWECFRAPVAGIVCMQHELGLVDSLAVGMFLHTFVLALTARGLGTGVQVSIMGYPEVIREQLDIPEEFTIVCGMSIGYADPDFPANKIRVGRQPIEQNVVFVGN